MIDQLVKVSVLVINQGVCPRQSRQSRRMLTALKEKGYL